MSGSHKLYILYSFNLDEIKKGAVIECGLLSPWIALNKRLAAIATDTRCSALLVDLESGMMKHRFPTIQDCQNQDTVQPAFMSPSVISLCNTGTGGVTLHDIRVSSPGQHINRCE